MIKGLGHTSLYGFRGGTDYCAACLRFLLVLRSTLTPLISLTGSINASFCPAVSGCREVVITDGRIALDFDQNSWQLPTISVMVPPRKTLFLVSGVCDKSNTHKSCLPTKFDRDVETNEISKTYFCVKSAALELFRFSTWHAEVLSPQCYAISPTTTMKGLYSTWQPHTALYKLSFQPLWGRGRLHACYSPALLFLFQKKIEQKYMT